MDVVNEDTVTVRDTVTFKNSLEGQDNVELILKKKNKKNTHTSLGNEYKFYDKNRISIKCSETFIKWV